MNDWLQIIQQSLFPPTCLVCGAQGSNGEDLCRGCRTSLPYTEYSCPRCALPLTVADSICGRCLKQLPVFQAARAAFAYREPIRHLITALKFHRDYPAARLLGSLLSETLTEYPAQVDVLIPVPLHPARFRQRGFNPSAEIARVLGQRLRIPVAHGLACRTKCTASQVGLTARQRERNVRRAFSVSADLGGCRVAIVDDVMTTGSTLNELAKALSQRGCLQIEAWVCARALL